MAPIVGYGTFTAIAMTAWEYTGGLRGKRPEIEGMDEFDRRENLRKNRRRPIEETLANVGEGRGECFQLARMEQIWDLKLTFAGIQPPGFNERRKERLEEKYGVEIKTVSALAS